MQQRRTGRSRNNEGVHQPAPEEAAEIPSTTIVPEPEEELPVLESVAPPEGQPTTRSEELAISLDRSDRLSPQDAVDAFALVYPDMPGATPTDLPPSDVTTSSHAWNLINSVWDQLSDDQLAFIDEQAGGEVIGTVSEGGVFVAGPPEAGAEGALNPIAPAGTAGRFGEAGTSPAPLKPIKPAPPFWRVARNHHSRLDHLRVRPAATQFSLNPEPDLDRRRYLHRRT